MRRLEGLAIYSTFVRDEADITWPKHGTQAAA